MYKRAGFTYLTLLPSRKSAVFFPGLEKIAFKEDQRLVSKWVRFSINISQMVKWSFQIVIFLTTMRAILNSGTKAVPQLGQIFFFNRCRGI